MARRELRSLSSEKTIVLALLVQLVIAAFSSFLVVGLAALYTPTDVDGGGVMVGVAGNASGEAYEAVAATPGVNGRRYPSEARALDAYRAGRVDAVVAATHRARRIAVTATVPASSLRKTLIVVKVRETLETFERNERDERAAHLQQAVVRLPRRVDGSPYYGFTYTVLVPLLLFIPAFISGSLAVDAVTEEVARGTLDLLRVAPLSLTGIIDGKGFAAVALAPVQAAIWLGLLSLNGIAIHGVLPLLGLATGLALTLVALGTAIAGLDASRQRAQLLYSTTALVLLTAAALLPEHPATTAARLAIGSATRTTLALGVGYLFVGVAAAAVVRRWIASIEPERL